MNHELQQIKIWLSNFLSSINQDIIKTIIILFTTILIYKFIIFIINKQNLPIEKKYNLKKSARNTLIIIFFIIEFFMWSGEIKTVLLSAAAITAATIVAFKEIILCMVGSILIKSNQIFEIGDYIEYDNVKGKVIDKTLLYTKLLVGQSLQAQEMNIPNVVFFTQKVSNLSRFGKYQRFDLFLFVPNMNHISKYKNILETSILTYLKLNKEKYDNYFKSEKLKNFLFEIPPKFYSVQYDLTEGKNIRLKVSVLSDPLDYKELEEYIINTYIESVEAQLATEKEKEPENEDIN